MFVDFVLLALYLHFEKIGPYIFKLEIISEIKKIDLPVTAF